MKKDELLSVMPLRDWQLLIGASARIINEHAHLEKKAAATHWNC